MSSDDIVALAGVVLGTMIFLIPVAGFTLRFTLKPLIEAYAKARGSADEVRRLSFRVQALETELELLRGTPPMHLEFPSSAPFAEPRLPEHKS